jgi:hypothetical protein
MVIGIYILFEHRVLPNIQTHMVMTHFIGFLIRWISTVWNMMSRVVRSIMMTIRNMKRHGAINVTLTYGVLVDCINAQVVKPHLKGEKSEN